MINKSASLHKSIVVNAFIAIALVNTLIAMPVFSQNNDVLHGSVNEQSYINKGKTPGLNLQDLNNSKDSFGSSPNMGMPAMGEGESFEPPPSAFNLNANQNQQVATSTPPGLAEESKIDFGQPNVPGLDSDNALNGSAQQYNGGVENDPDSSPEMQVAWDAWHKRVAAAIYDKFNTIAQAAFRYSKPLTCYVTYTVTNDGRVINVQMPQKSTNIAFNAMVLLVINSMTGQTALLAFPQGSRRTFVNKAGSFTQNTGVQGFKYTTGDRETIPGK